jgi:uncharacterized protein YegJ (DUF2314 family)
MMRCFLILILIALAGCKGNPGVVEKTEDKEGQKKAYAFSGDNEEMNAAIQEAIRYYPLFERAMQQPDTSLTDFCLKMKFNCGDGCSEHMWLSNLHMVGGQYFGVLTIEPRYAQGIKLGDTIRVIRNDITDWRYLKNGKLQGGYTIKVIYNSLKGKEKQEYQESYPFKIE